MNELILTELNTINPQNKSDLRKLFNNVEDMCYYYNAEDIGEESKKNIEMHLIDISKWVNRNSNIIGDYPNKYYEIFKNIQSDLSKMDDVVANIITPVYNETLYNWLHYFKSSNAFYDVKGNHTSDKNEIDLLIKNANKSVRMEKCASYTLYIVSGKASEDYIPNGTGSYYKSKAEAATNKPDLDLISRKPYDGYTDEYVLFATSNTNTRTQDIYKALKQKKDASILFVYAPYFNQKYSYVETDYAGKKAQQHGTSFLKKFNNDFNHNELGNFNLLPFMALLNNVKIPEDTDINISDILRVNPFAIGTDTYHVYKDFRDLNEYREPEKTEKLLEYTVDYVYDITKKLTTINDNFEFDEVTSSIFANTQKILLASLRNFNKSNLLNEIPNEAILDKLYKSINNYNIAYNKSSRDNKISNELNDANDFLEVDDMEDLIDKYKKRNKRLNKKYEIRNEEKIPLSNYSTIKYDDILDSINIPKIDRDLFISMIQKRQLDSKQNVFSAESVQHYLWYRNNRDVDIYREIFNFIENNNDFNNPEVVNDLIDRVDIVNEKIDLISTDQIIDKLWQMQSGGRYKMPPGLVRFLKDIKNAGENGISCWSLPEMSRKYYETNVYYRNSNSFFEKAKNGSEKTIASNSIFEACGLYNDKRKLVYSEMVSNIKEYMKKNNKTIKNKM